MPILTEREDLEPIAAKAQAYADHFELPLKDRTWRGNAGEFAGSGVGSSLDFQDHRNYLPGDDPRHINWQAYARTGSYSMKLYREEVRPMVEIILDVSDSMFFDPDKQNRVLELFYFANFAAVKSGASTLVYVVKGSQQKRFPSEVVFSHAWTSLVAEMPETENSAGGANISSISMRAQSLRIFISDLLFPKNPEHFLRELGQGKGRGIILCPYAESESNPGWEGNYEFIDVETSDHHNHRVDRSLLARYLTAYRRHFEMWKTASLKFQIPVARIPANSPFETAIQMEAIPAGAITV